MRTNYGFNPLSGEVCCATSNLSNRRKKFCWFQSPFGGSMLRNLERRAKKVPREIWFQSPFGGSMLRNPTPRRMPLFCV